MCTHAEPNYRLNKQFMAKIHWMLNVYYKLAVCWLAGSGVKKKMQTQNSQSGNRNLTVSQSNLSSCQTSLTAAEGLFTV